MSVTRKFVRELHKARKEKTPRFREPFTFGNGDPRWSQTFLCESKKEYEHLDTWQDALNDGSLKPGEFSIRELFEECFPDGQQLVQELKYPNQDLQKLIEAAGGIASSDFSSISGQIVYTRLIEKAQQEAFAFTNIIPTQSTPYDGEKIAGIDGLGDQAAIVPELTEFPLVGTGQDYIETPRTTKRGFIVPISREAIFFDRTGDLLNQASKVGYWLGANKEKRAIDCVIDENTTTHRYNWRGTSYATYQTTTPWVNITASNALVDWTDIDGAQQKLNGMTDPGTGEPIVIGPTTLFCCQELEWKARQIVNATQIVYHVGGYATSGNLSDTIQGNPLRNSFEIVSTALMAARQATDTTWYYGDPRQAFVYMENWPIAVIRRDEGSAMFNRDIVTQFRCSERGQYAVIQPRAMTENTA